MALVRDSTTFVFKSPKNMRDLDERYDKLIEEIVSIQALQLNTTDDEEKAGLAQQRIYREAEAKFLRRCRNELIREARRIHVIQQYDLDEHADPIAVALKFIHRLRTELGRKLTGDEFKVIYFLRDYLEYKPYMKE